MSGTEVPTATRVRDTRGDECPGHVDYVRKMLFPRAAAPTTPVDVRTRFVSIQVDVQFGGRMYEP